MSRVYIFLFVLQTLAICSGVVLGSFQFLKSTPTPNSHLMILPILIIPLAAGFAWVFRPQN
jgi:hypothetical protein